MSVLNYGVKEVHFTVMVFGDDVERQLAPFQECDVGLIAPEYMVKVDFTDEVEKQFQARRRYGLLGDGRYVELGQAHHCDASGKLVLITGAVVVEMSADEARTHRLGYATMDDAAADIGAKREGDRFVIEDNINSHWDWWVVGGRWGSMLKLLPGRQGHTAMPREFDPELAKILNQPPPEIWQPTPGYCDQARKIDIDWVGMRTEAGSRAGTEWDLVHTWTKGVPWSAWAEVCGKFADDVDVARHHYWSQPAIEAIRKGQQTVPPERRRWDIDDAWSGPREEYVARAEANAGVTYAVLFNGAWVQSDMVDQEASQNWNERFHAILDLVPDAAMVTIVDYHV